MWELFVLAGLFILAVAIFYVTGAGMLGPKYRLITYLPEVEGLEHRRARAARWRGDRQRAINPADAASAGRGAQYHAGDAHRQEISKRHTNRFHREPDHRRVAGQSLRHDLARAHRHSAPVQRHRAWQGGGGHEADGRARRGPDAESGRAVGRSARNRGSTCTRGAARSAN